MNFEYASENNQSSVLTDSQYFEDLPRQFVEELQKLYPDMEWRKCKDDEHSYGIDEWADKYCVYETERGFRLGVNFHDDRQIVIQPLHAHLKYESFEDVSISVRASEYQDVTKFVDCLRDSTKKAVKRGMERTIDLLDEAMKDVQIYMRKTKNSN